MKVKTYTPKQKTSILKNKKLYTYVLGLGIILLMVSSALTYYADNDDSEIEYNGYLFFTDDYGSWRTNYEGQQIQFQYNPTELEDIQADITFTPITYLVLNDPYTVDQPEIQRTAALLSFKGVSLQMACKSENECQDDTYPIVSCEDGASVLEFKSSDTNSITKNNNCITVNHNNNRVIERLSFEILEIM